MNEKLNYNILLDMLGIVLVEIRSADKKSYARIMSDIFHNVPARIIAELEPKDIYDDMYSIAKRHEAEVYLEKLLSHSLSKYK